MQHAVLAHIQYVYRIICIFLSSFPLDCTKLTFDGYSRYPPNDETAKFNLHAYTYEESGYKWTAFNFSVTNVDFRGKNCRVK